MLQPFCPAPPASNYPMCAERSYYGSLAPTVAAAFVELYRERPHLLLTTLHQKTHDSGRIPTESLCCSFCCSWGLRLIHQLHRSRRRWAGDMVKFPDRRAVGIAAVFCCVASSVPCKSACVRCNLVGSPVIPLISADLVIVRPVYVLSKYPRHAPHIWSTFPC